MKVYFDNAATTPLDEAVFNEMKPYLLEHFGNPSSIHSHGRQARAAVEKARKTVAGLLNTSPSEIFFTSGGTESDNTAIRGSVTALGLDQIITSPLEHHAVLHTAEYLQQTGSANLRLLATNSKGHLDLEELEELLKQNPRSLVSLIHGNNELGNLNDLQNISTICRLHGAFLHSDTVQTVGHFPIDLQELDIDFIVGSAHKFHGPKGTGFLYVNHNNKIPPFIQGGAQERNMRGGTENVAGIVGLAKALELACENMEAHRQYVTGLKERMVSLLKEKVSGVSFNGDSGEINQSLYTVLNVSLPPHPAHDMLLFNLDINGISASGGSACASGSSIGSHVLSALRTNPERGAIRFSFSRLNTIEEVDYTVDKLAEILTSQ